MWEVTQFTPFARQFVGHPTFSGLQCPRSCQWIAGDNIRPSPESSRSLSSHLYGVKWAVANTAGAFGPLVNCSFTPVLCFTFQLATFLIHRNNGAVRRTFIPSQGVRCARLDEERTKSKSRCAGASRTARSIGQAAERTRKVSTLQYVIVGRRLENAFP